jgi:hypothetical protein
MGLFSVSINYLCIYSYLLVDLLQYHKTKEKTKKVL